MSRGKVIRAFERWEGTEKDGSLHKYVRGKVLTAKELARLAIKPPNARYAPLDSLVSSGAIFIFPDEIKPGVE